MLIRDGLCVYRDPQNPDVLTQAEVDTVSTGVKDFGPSLAVQSQAEEADINEIVRRFGIGKIPEMSVPLPPGIGEFEDIFDFQSAQNLLVAASRSFAGLPAQVRRHFDYDPGAFVQYCEDARDNPEYQTQLRTWGLAIPAKPADTAPAVDSSSPSPSPSKQE